MGLDYVILAYLKVVHYFYGSVSSLNILAFLPSVFTRLVNYLIEHVLDEVFYIYYLSKIFHIYRNYDTFHFYSECPLIGFYLLCKCISINICNLQLHFNIYCRSSFILRIKTLPQIMNLRYEILVNLQGNPREVPISRKPACTKCETLTLNARKTTGRR
jgi:hypothetical protein